MVDEVDKASYLQTLGNGLAVLELFVQEPALTIAEIAERTGGNRINVYRLLRTLEAHDLVYRDPGDDRLYKLSPTIARFARAAVPTIDIPRVGAEIADELVRLWGETVHVAVYNDGDIVYVFKADGLQPLRAYTEVGQRAPSYCTATGKALLARQSSQEIHRVVARGLTRFTPLTLADEASLERELAEVRERGYSVNRGEWRGEIGGIGVPVLGNSQGPDFAIGISGPIPRILENLDRKVASMLELLSSYTTTSARS